MRDYIHERIIFFKKYWKIDKLTKQKQEQVMNYFTPIINIKFYLGEPITGKNCNINCISIINLINK
jgi:hypothetical protein